MRLTLVALLALTSATSAAAQSIASRVAQAPAGVVHLQFDGRPGVCGDGRETVAFGKALFSRNFQSFGRWSGVRCVPGPLRVSLTTSGGQVTRMQTQVGGAWPSTDARVTDLGTVSSVEASAYFFSLVPRLEAETGKDRLLLPAVLAEGADVVAPLLTLARDESRLDQTRRQAVQWLGLLGDASVIPALVTFAKQDVNDDGEDKHGKKSVASSAVMALSQLDGDVGVPALIDLARTGSVGTRRNAAFWLGQNGDPRARRMLHAMIEDTNEESRVRQHAIFSLANGGDETPASEFAYLRSVYARLDSDKLKESIFQGMANDGTTGATFLLDRARDANETTKLRRSALFWAGQRQETPTADLLSVYRDATDTQLREHAIFVLSQRQDEAAMDALMRIAREDDDKKMRGKALFWLAQKKDPRVTKLLSDMVLK